MTIVVLSPHGDDAASSVSLAIDSWLNLDHRVVVLDFFTRSQYAPFSDLNGIPLSQQMDWVTSLRQAEHDRWRKHLSDNLILTALDLGNARLRFGCSPDGVCQITEDWQDGAALKIPNHLRTVGAEAIDLPLAIGRHIDHLAARDAVRGKFCSNLPCPCSEDLPPAACPGEEEQIEHTALQLRQGIAPASAGNRLWANKASQASALADPEGLCQGTL